MFNRKEYRRVYYINNGEKELKQHREYRRNNKEHIGEYYKQWCKDNPEKIKEQKKRWRRIHLGEIIKLMKKWRADNPERVREIDKRHLHKRQRNLGFIPLNKSFSGAVAHHINTNDIIYMPAKLHKGVPHCLETGRNMKIINGVARQWI